MSMKKLQAEIDRVLKKVNEGVEEFDFIYEKIQSSNNTNQKEKYEQDLKKEIKKLQRLRDQLKTWISSNDVKDKSVLLENKKTIESEMERFKNVEREMKTKAFSKEGLLQRERLDPKEQEKADACDWISSTVDELSRQIEAAEAEIETLRGTSRKGRKDHSKTARITELEHFIERDRWHINRLELILRLLENDHLAPEKVLSIQDDLQYYLECNQEPDFEEDEFVYDDLNLEEEEELYNVGIEEHNTNYDEKPLNKKSKEIDHEETALKKSQSSKPSPAKVPIHVPPVKAVENTPVKSATNTPKLKSALANKETTAIEEKVQSPKTVVPSAWAEPIKITSKSSTPNLEKKEISTKSIFSSASEAQNNSKSTQKEKPSSKASLNPRPANKESRLPNSLSDLAVSFEAIKSKISRQEDPLYRNRMLETSLQHVPDLIDSERVATYQPRTPQLTPSYYPQQPLAIFDNPHLFDKFDTDTLFFIFYYQQNSYQQYLAAKELKKQSWRFHKKYLTWFQRQEEPKVITDDYEQGSYIYFDYESAWCQRKKTDFRFDYQYLEDA